MSEVNLTDEKIEFIKEILVGGFGLSLDEAQSVIHDCSEAEPSHQMSCIFHKAQSKLSEWRSDFVRTQIQEYLEKKTQQEREAYIESLRVLDSKNPDDDNDPGSRI
ncbi:hypothetical protein [Thiomicrospira sp.]|uniref:hypothetical protein n=1 Tax=Thiomicrospira sp. TaxID=935 RepID=UPI002F94FC77